MSRSVRVVTTGGTIAMSGSSAVPSLGAEQIAALLPDSPGVRTEAFGNVPSVHLSGDDALALARHVCAAAEAGDAVVVTHGTDVLEEVAYLCDLMYAGAAPVIFTGAIRPAGAPGADGPANLRDSVVAAGHPSCEELGVLVCFAGALHAAGLVAKVDSVSPAAFGSPQSGPIGYVNEDRVWIAARPVRGTPLAVEHLRARVEILQGGIGAEPWDLATLRGRRDGLVLVVSGAGHVHPDQVDFIARAAAELPVVVVAQPARGTILRSTYGFPGSEQDVRAAGAICAGALRPVAARIKLLAALGAGLADDDLRAAFAVDDL